MKRNRFLSLLLCAILLLSILPTTITKAAGIWDGGETQPPGLGTSGSPYQISTGRELKWFAAQVNGGNTGIYAILTADILLNDTDNWENWASSPPANTWIPIGSEANKFRGIFDGRGYTISGVYINSADSYQGLFGYIGFNGTGTVKNVKLVSSYIKGQSYVGGICGYMYFFSEISGCENSATIIGTGSYSGGITGNSPINSNLRDCRNTGSVTGGNMMTGGITGSNNGTITGCVNQGAVSGSGSWVGGLVGINYAALSDSYNTGSVNVSGGSYVGGLCGTNGFNGTITNAYNTGSVTGGWPVCGNTEAGSSLANVYYLGSSLNNGIGIHAGTGTTADKSEQQFASGEVAYLMGATYGQTLGSGGNPSPVFRTSDDINAVYRLTYMNGAAEHGAQYYNAGTAVSSAGIANPIIDSGTFLNWGGLPDIMPAQDVTVTANFTSSPPQITTVSLPSGTTNMAYNARIEATGTTPITYAVVSGNLPAGLTLNGSTGEITGTPTEEGNSTPTIRAQNDYGQYDKQFSIDISLPASEMPGSGTSGDPYQIWTASHLIQFADKVNTTLNTRFYAVLMADISLNDTSGWENWEISAPDNTWTPIGINSTYSFKGGFDGSNHTISGVYINNSDNYMGLFGYVSAATTVKNINLDKSYIKGNTYVGGICGASATLCNVENCRSNAAVSGVRYVGGVCGSVLANNANIINCQNDGEVTGTQLAGGITGMNSGTVDACRNSGILQGGASGTSIGGICGSSNGTVKNTYNAGSIYGGNNIGGICGVINGLAAKTAVIENVHNRGNISGPSNAAAICGAANVYCSLTNCYFLDSSATSGIGYNAGSYSAVSKSEELFASGETAYLLGSAFGQTLGTDAYPIFRSSNDDNAVYKLIYMNETQQHAEQYYNAGNTVSAAGISSPGKDGHYFSVWENLPGTMPADNVTVSALFLPLTQVSLLSTTADGAAGTTTSTKIDLIFSTEITGLTEDSITITGGTGSAVKGALTGAGTTWSIALTSVAAEGSVTLTVTTPDGYILSNETKTVAVYKYEPPAAAVPSAPQNVSAAPGDEQVTLNWSAPESDGGAAITKYEVSKDDGASWSDADSTAEHTFTGLTNGQSRTFKVRAVNSAGAGAAASVTAAPQAPATAPSAPQNVSAAPGDEQVTLNWSAPESDGGAAITKYEVSKDDGASWSDADSTAEHTFTGLTNGQSCTFKVRAVNSAGAGTAASATAAPQAPATDYCIITASAGSGGSISPSGAIYVAQGGSKTFSITANSNYSILSVIVDGVDQGAISSYDFNNVTGSHDISATFQYAGGGSEDDYVPRNLTSNTTGIMVSGSGIHKNAVLTVTDINLHASGTDTACDAIRQRINDDAYTLLLAKDISLSPGFTGTLTISMPVDEQYNGQTVTILHCANGTLQTYTATVTNGKAVFSVSSLSPFALFVKNENTLSNLPQTGGYGSALIWWGLLTLVVLSLLTFNSLTKRGKC